MNPKSGKAAKAVAPQAPDAAEDADVADPGKAAAARAAQKQSGSGKYGAAAAKPNKPADKKADETDKKSWIEIELLDEANQPVAGEKYEITLPDGTIEKGTLDAKGFARVDGIDPGTCKVCFPNLDKDAWKKA